MNRGSTLLSRLLLCFVFLAHTASAGELVRLTDIDAPEKKQPFGTRSRQSLADLCAGKDARIAEQGKDRYGRTLGRVYCAGVDANAEQVRLGLAWVYR